MSAAPYWNLYCSAREAIKEAAAATAPMPKGSSKDETGEAAPPQPELEVQLERLVQEAHRNSSSQRGNQAPISSASSAADTQEKRPGVSKRARQEDSGPEGSKWDAEGTTAEEEGEDDKCLGVIAEAFADDLDYLRKDEHFGGSARDVAAMADMMRCLADGLDPTEQRLLLGTR